MVGPFEDKVFLGFGVFLGKVEAVTYQILPAFFFVIMIIFFAV